MKRIHRDFEGNILKPGRFTKRKTIEFIADDTLPDWLIVNFLRTSGTSDENAYNIEGDGLSKRLVVSTDLENDEKTANVIVEKVNFSEIREFSITFRGTRFSTHDTDTINSFPQFTFPDFLGDSDIEALTWELLSDDGTDFLLDRDGGGTVVDYTPYDIFELSSPDKKDITFFLRVEGIMGIKINDNIVGYVDLTEEQSDIEELLKDENPENIIFRFPVRAKDDTEDVSVEIDQIELELSQN